MTSSYRKAAIQTVQTVLSADLACSEADIVTGGVSIHCAERREGRFRFPFRDQSLNIVTLGKGVVVSCNSERMEWARQNLGHLTRGQIFSSDTIAKIANYVHIDNQSIAGPDQKYICSKDDFAGFITPQGVHISTYSRDQINNLYEHTYFRHALSFRIDSSRPDRLASVAICEGKIVGIAGASEDCERMWQIGVDVLPEFQGRGIGKAIVGILTKAILDEGIIPFYSTEVSNLHSRQLAISLGYWPAWVQLYAR